MMYSAKAIFLFERLKNNEGENAYEERVVLLHANSFDEAILKAEDEARDYASKEKAEYINFVNVFKLFDQKLTFNGIKEIYSLMRYESDNPQDYLDFFYDTGKECTDVLE